MSSPGPPSLVSEPCLGAGYTYLHGLEGPESVELKLHLHIAAGEAEVAPTHVVIAWPDPQLLALPKVIQPHHTICQLAQTSILQPKEEGPRKRMLEEKEVSPAQVLCNPDPGSGLANLMPLSSHPQDYDGYSESHAAQSTHHLPYGVFIVTISNRCVSKGVPSSNSYKASQELVVAFQSCFCPLRPHLIHPPPHSSISQTRNTNPHPTHLVLPPIPGSASCKACCFHPPTVCVVCPS